MKGWPEKSRSGRSSLAASGWSLGAAATKPSLDGRSHLHEAGRRCRPDEGDVDAAGVRGLQLLGRGQGHDVDGDPRGNPGGTRG